MKKNRKLWIVSAALVAVVLVAALCLLLPRLQVEPGVPKSGAIVRQEAAEDGRQLFVLERDMEHMSLQDIMDESDLVVMGFLLEQSPGFQVKSTDGEVSTFTNYFFQVTDTYRGGHLRHPGGLLHVGGRRGRGVPRRVPAHLPAQ